MTKVLFSGTKSRPPIIATGSLSIVEGNTDIQVVATQPHGGGRLTYGITGGADAALFDIVDTGLMYFLVAPVFASPTDANTDNVYEVEVTVTGRGGLTDTQLILITVLESGGGGDTVGTPIGLLFLLTHTIAAAYHASAVHLDGSTWLHTASLTAPASNGYLSCSFWIKCPSDMTGLMLWVSDPENNYDFNMITTNAFQFQVGLFSLASDGDVYGNTAFASLNDQNWHHVLMYSDTQQASSSKTINFVIDGSADSFVYQDASGNAFNQVYNAVSFWIGADNGTAPGGGQIADIADLWIAPGILHTDATTFRDPGTGKPKDPSGFPSAAILFSGDHTAFSTNQGTGGTFTLTGSLTNASTSPSD